MGTKRYFMLIGWSLVAGCTFGDLAGYEIGVCDPNIKNFSEDICKRLTPADACHPYQCDAIERRCFQRARDDDRDGDPSIECGGKDCNDDDSAVSSLAKEICDGKDNDCNGILDDGVLVPHASVDIESTGLLPPYPDVSIARPNDSAIMGTYVARNGQGLCIQSINMIGAEKGFIYQNCSFLTDTPSLVPRQPFSMPLPQGGAGAIFVTTSACSMGLLSYRYTGQNSAGVIDEPCTPPGVALPSWLPSETGDTGTATWYEVAFHDRDDPFARCAGAQAVPLWVASLESPASDKPTLGIRTKLPGKSTGVRPAAILNAGDKGVALVAAPLEGDVGVWYIGSDHMPEAPVHVPGLAGARAVALAGRAEKEQIHLALVAEIGCAPQAIAVAFGVLDTMSHQLTFDQSSEVRPSGDLVAAQPTVGWVEVRKEWLVTWVNNDGPTLKGRRFTAEGKPIGAALPIGTGIEVAGIAADGTIAAFNQSKSLFLQVPLICP